MKSPPKIHQTSLPADNVDVKNEINVKVSDGEKDNTTGEQFRDLISKYEEHNSSVAENNKKDEKSKKVIDKLRDLFKF